MSDFARILAVDPGDKRLGIAISDFTGTIASPLCVLPHVSREEDARAILTLAEEKEASLIVIGQAVNWDGDISFQGRKSTRLAEKIRTLGSLPVLLWNEYGSTSAAINARRMMNVSRKKRAGHLDDLAATVILQTYLDSQSSLEES
jgi:putative Holliday junction resolvase